MQLEHLFSDYWCIIILCIIVSFVYLYGHRKAFCIYEVLLATRDLFFFCLLYDYQKFMQ